MKKTILLISLFLISETLFANNISLVESKSPVIILPRNKKDKSQFGKHMFQFGTVPINKTTVLLKIKSRMQSSGMGGSSAMMRITVNGQLLTSGKGRLAMRLKNKPLVAPITPKLMYNWYDKSNKSWNVIYSPDFTTVPGFYVGNPYTYVFDITDLINPIAENRIEILNTTPDSYLASYYNEKTSPYKLVIGTLEVMVRPGSSPMMTALTSKQSLIVNRGTPAAGPASYQGKLLPGGGFSIKMGNNTYKFNSKFSYPNAGFNYLNAGAPVASKNGWKVSVKNNQAIAKGNDYKIVRTVKFTPRRVEVNDAVTNLNKHKALGLAVRNEIDLGKQKDMPIRIAGNPDQNLTKYFSAANPSIHIVVPDGGIGIIAEDDVMRAQLCLYTRVEKKKIIPGLSSDMLRLAPGETYSLKWAVYPVAGPDYYDFINLVRQDWGANYTTFGVWRWGASKTSKMSVKQIRELFKRQGIKYVFMSDWVEWGKKKDGTQRIGFGSDIFSDYWKYRRNQYIKKAEKLRKAVPDIKVLAYFNSMRETSDDVKSRFPEAIQIDQHGNFIGTKWTHTGAPNKSSTMAPTLENKFGEKMVDVARRYMDDMKMDGIYWDEMSAICFNQILYTYNNFDGHSCILDPKTWTIKREVGIIPLTCRKYYNKVINTIQKKDGTMLINGANLSRSMLKYKIPRMMEVQDNNRFGYSGHLQSPFGYMAWNRGGWKDFIRVIGIGLLPAVCIDTELKHDISQYLFPFTPVEIHAGYILGEERIVATHSGNYGWLKTYSLAQVRHFNNIGKLTKKDFPTKIKNEARTAVKLKAKEAIVLERLPMSFEPSGKKIAEVQKVSYSKKFISLYLKAPQGGILKIKNGKFALQNSKTVEVSLGKESLLIKVANGTLRVIIPVDFSGDINIKPKGE